MWDVPVTDFLNLKDMESLHVHDNGMEYLVEAQSTLPAPTCPDCRAGQGVAYRHGVQEHRFRDTPMHGKMVCIVVKHRRFRCQSCQKTWFEALPAMDSKRRVTRRLMRHVREHVFRETFAALARRVALDEKTVRNVFEDYAAELEATFRFRTPRVLGIDELKIVGAYRAIITNIEHRCLFDMRATRSKQDLLAYFQAMPDKHRVEWVTMDMYHVYRGVVHQTLPKARIIVDRFHIQRMGNEVIEAMRKRFRKTLPARQRLKLKDERFLLLKRQHDLTPADFERLAVWFKQFPLLSEAHALKEGFLAIWDHTTRSSAETAWQQWLANVPSELEGDFKALIRAMTNWHQEIFNYFENPMTNAFTESSNNLTRVMNRMGRGYSFDVIRARMLFNDLANKQGTLIQRKSAPAPGKSVDDGLMGKALPSPQMEPVDEVIMYGAHIPTLAKLADEGYFD